MLTCHHIVAARGTVIEARQRGPAPHGGETGKRGKRGQTTFVQPVGAP